MSIGETKPILEPGRPGDLRMIFEVAVEDLHKLMLAGIGKGGTDDDEVRAVALAMQKAIKMWLGEIPVDEMPILNS